MMTITKSMKMTIKPNPKPKVFHAALGLLGLAGLLTGCRAELATIANAQSEPRSTPTRTPLPTFTPSPWSATATPTSTSTATPLPTITPWPSPTAWPTATPWSAPVAWQPGDLVLSTVAPLPVVPTAASLPAVAIEGAVPLNYAPPNEVDVAGNVMLRWDYPGLLAEDEFFDIKIKPYGSENSVFVDWTKSTEYELRPWSGWTPGVYTWQIGIIKGYLDGEAKNFIADTGRDSAKFVIKWQPVGGGDGGSNGGGGGRSGGS
ncbi:MAG TPA: hypothetical protein PKD98_21400 [Anaerolineae bacterium]|nr:hypothetical protein [Anaerolineae bacterium]